MEQLSLKERYPILIGFLKKHGYAHSYIRKFETEVRVILRMRKKQTWVSYEDLYKQYCEIGYGSKYLRSKKSILGLVAQFDTWDIFPGGPGIFSNFVRQDALETLSPEFRSVILYYRAVEEKRGIEESTITTSSRNTTSFFRQMLELGITELGQIEEHHILDFFYSNGHLRYGHSFKKNIKAVFKACTDKYSECQNIVTYLPDLRETRKNIQYLTTEEAGRIRKALNDLDNTLNYRDRAVGALLMYTGLRSCDIANLKMQDIHWKDDVITIYQQKTSVALTLPLRAVVGNPIFDYITKERPQSKDLNLFVSETRPHRAISPTAVSTHIAGNIFNAAGVRMGKTDRRGSHIFRHLLAITLLENGIPQPVISSTLGHTSPDSTETYLSADFTHLKECGINIANYPISEEVFNV
jgi:integrase